MCPERPSDPIRVTNSVRISMRIFCGDGNECKEAWSSVTHRRCIEPGECEVYSSRAPAYHGAPSLKATATAGQKLISNW